MSIGELSAQLSSLRVTLAGKDEDLHTAATAAADDRDAKAAATVAAAALSDQLSGLSEQLRASKEAVERSDAELTEQDEREKEENEKKQFQVWITYTCYSILPCAVLHQNTALDIYQTQHRTCSHSCQTSLIPSSLSSRRITLIWKR